MKPHEEAWRVLPEANRLWRVVSDTHRDGDSQTVCRHLNNLEAALIAAAPEMARALLNLLPHFSVTMTRDEAEAITLAQAALRKAGVLP